MTHLKKWKGNHTHRWFIDLNSNDYVCVCGVTKGKDEKRKYHNHSQTYNGHTYHSKFEARYAAELDYLVKSGDIKSWDRQVKLDLRVSDQHITNYYIDFIVHHHDGSREFIECKGQETSDWKLKWRLLEATFEQFKKHPDDIMVLVKEKNHKLPKKKSTKTV